MALTTALTSLNLSTAFMLVVALLLHFLSPTFCSNHKLPPESIRDLLVAEKTRMGSTPPSCHNKCNNCHPCMAVQVPTMPSHDRLQPATLSSTKPVDYFHSSPSPFAGNNNNRYSNYMPLGWKCRCGGHFYNP